MKDVAALTCSSGCPVFVHLEARFSGIALSKTVSSDRMVMSKCSMSGESGEFGVDTLCQVSVISWVKN